MWKSRVTAIGGMITVVGSLFFTAPVRAEVEIFQSDVIAETEMPASEEAAAISAETAAVPEPAKEEIITREVGITEKFHSDFDLYEGSIQNKYFFYSNISNGGITDDYVYFEIPAELQVLMEKDGALVSYGSGQELREPGNYLMYLSASEQADDRRIDYQAVFRFKIQEKTEESSAKETTAAESDTSQEIVAAEELPEETYESAVDPFIGERGRDEDGNFHYTFKNGVKVVSGVPNGMLTSKAVSLEINGDENYQIYKDNDAIEWNNEGYLQDNGDYVVAAGGEAFCFRISGYISNSPLYYPPEGFRIKTAEFQNNQISITRDDCLEVRRDGKYQLELEDEEGFTLSCAFEKDSLPPEYEIELNSQGASVTYISDDIDRIAVYKDGREIGSGYSSMYDEDGRYRMVVYDLAGNQSVKEFRIPFHMNGFTIVLIMLIISAAAGVTIWFFILKKKIKVR